jgi:hypothetical protein
MANKVFSDAELQSLKASAYGADTRPLESVALSTLSNVHEEAVFYGIEPGEIIRFQPSYTKVEKQPMFEDEQRVNARGERPMQYFIPVTRVKPDGTEIDSLFNLNTLNKRDANNNFVHSAITSAGSLPARVARLCEWGAIIGGTEKTIMVAAFTPSGAREKETIIAPNGQMVVKNKVREGRYVPIQRYIVSSNPSTPATDAASTDAAPEVAADAATTDAPATQA